jgi:anti-sigma-K factor RskA
MPTSTMEQIQRLLPKLAAEDQDSVLEYIEFLSGESVLTQLSTEDRAELERRAAEAETLPMIPLRRVIAEARQRLAAKS